MLEANYKPCQYSLASLECQRSYCVQRIGIAGGGTFEKPLPTTAVRSCLEVEDKNKKSN